MLHNFHSLSSEDTDRSGQHLQGLHSQLEETRCLDQSRGYKITTPSMLTSKLTRKPCNSYQLMVYQNICPHLMTQMQTLSPYSSWILTTVVTKKNLQNTMPLVLAQLQVVLAVVVAFLVPVDFADFLFWPVVFFGVVLLLLLKLGIKSSGIPHNVAYLWTRKVDNSTVHWREPNGARRRALGNLRCDDYGPVRLRSSFYTGSGSSTKSSTGKMAQHNALHYSFLTSSLRQISIKCLSSMFKLHF